MASTTPIPGVPIETNSFAAAGALGVMPKFTVAKLPTANLANFGMRYCVTDAASPVFLSPVVGGGSSFTPVVCNGSAWIVG